MDMKRILQAIDGVATKPVAGVNDMARFLRAVSEADINQPAAPAAPAAPASGSTLPPEQLAYNQLRAQLDSLDFLQGSTGRDTFVAQDPELVAKQNAMRQKLAGMEAALKAKGIDARAEYDAPEPGEQPKQPVDLAAKYNSKNKVPQQPAAQQPVAATPQAQQTVQENSLSKFISIVSKNDVNILNESANPHKVSLPVQMAMQHYQQPKKVLERKESLIYKYFEQVEDGHLQEQTKKRQLINQYASQIAERVMQKVDERSVSQAQAHTMAAAAHNPAFAKKVGIKQSVAREFNRADKGKNIKSLPQRVQKEAGEAGWARTGMAGVGLQPINESAKGKKK